MVKNRRIAAGRVHKLISDFGGGTSLTNSPDVLPTHARNQVLEEARLQPGEVPLLASFIEPNHWTLLTTERFIWRDGEVRSSLTWPQVQDADVPESVWTGAQRRDEAKELIVKDSDGNSCIILVEPGLNAYDLILNAILMLAAGKRQTSA